jgi:hypothetical protein
VATRTRTAADSDATELISKLVEFQATSAKTDETACSVCVVASSGTGKTQLALSASVICPKNVKSVYLLMGNENFETTQEFYKPHVPLSHDIRTAFSSDAFVIVPDAISDGYVSAGFLLQQGFGEPLRAFGFLRVLLAYACEEEYALDDDRVCIEPIDFKTLQTYVDEKLQSCKFLVFMDEIPAAKKMGFHEAINLRNVLRALKICPILMSTHTGAQNAIPQYGASRGGLRTQPWIYIISKLPKNIVGSTTSDLLNQHQDKELVAFLRDCFKCDRPLVCRVLSESLSELHSTSATGVHAVQFILRRILNELWETKKSAWTEYPLAQLAMTFKVDTGLGKADGVEEAHKIVGTHFGSLKQTSQLLSLTMGEAELWPHNSLVTLPSPSQEPLLVLALLSWQCGGPKFPLLDTNGKAITLLTAYKTCKRDFEPAACVGNSEAKSRNGNVLEALVHGGFTLASFAKGLGGCTLDMFLTNLALLLCTQGEMQFGVAPLIMLRKALPSTLCDMIVPVLPPNNTQFLPSMANIDGVCVGSLLRPPNSEQRDGTVSYIIDQVPFIAVELKNLENGLTTIVAGEVFSRIKPGIKVEVLGTTRISSAGGLYSNGKTKPKKTAAEIWEDACSNYNHPAFKSPSEKLCVLTIDSEDHGKLNVKFLKIGGTEQTGEKDTIELLVVILLIPL